MHVDFDQLVAWIIAVIPPVGVVITGVRQVLGLGKDIAETKKARQELQDAKNKKSGEDDTSYAERMKALAEFAKAYVLLGFLIYLYRTSIAVMALYIVRWAYEMLIRRER